MEIKHDPEIGSPAVATSDSASFQRTNHASAFQQFPDEVLDLVFKTMDTTSAASLRHKPIPKQAVTQSWEACALVCRRWYNIVLPHLFRSVPIRDDVYEYVDQFYTTHPHLAHLVRSVYLSIDREVSIQPLDELLKALPSLQSLNIRETCFSECRYPDQVPTGTYAIEELRYEYDTFIGGVGPSHIQGIACDLGLFSHIGRLETYQTDRQLEIDWEGWFEFGHYEGYDYSDSHGKLDIGELELKGRGTMDTILLPRYFRQVGAVQHLTRLCLSFEEKYGLTGLRDLLIAVKSTLQVLSIHLFPRYTREGDVHSEVAMNNRNFTAEPLRRGLSACSSLEEIDVEIESLVHTLESIGMFHCEPGRIPDRVIEGTEIAIDYISHVPKDRLRRVRINLREYDFAQMHELPWQSLRTLCEGLPRLECVELELSQEWDQRGCLAYEMRTFVARGAFTPRYIPTYYIEDSPPASQCYHPDCREFNMRRANSQI